METNEYIKEGFELLKKLYKDDMTAMSHIISAEVYNDRDILLSYLVCVEKFINVLKENI